MPVTLPQADTDLHQIFPTRTENVSAGLTYEGFAKHHTTPVTAAEWAIRRVTRTGNLIITEWARAGRYDCVWNDRATYFGAPPSPGPDAVPEAMPLSYSESGEVDAGSATFVDVTGAEIELDTETKYRSPTMLCSCRRAAHFKLIRIDGEAEHVLADVILDAGQYTFQYQNGNEDFTTGADGDQILKVSAVNLDGVDGLSALRAKITLVRAS